MTRKIEKPKIEKRFSKQGRKEYFPRDLIETTNLRKQQKNEDSLEEEEFYAQFNEIKLRHPNKKESSCQYSDVSLKEEKFFDNDMMKMLNSPNVRKRSDMQMMPGSMHQKDLSLETSPNGVIQELNKVKLLQKKKSSNEEISKLCSDSALESETNQSQYREDSVSMELSINTGNRNYLPRIADPKKEPIHTSHPQPELKKMNTMTAVQNSNMLKYYEYSPSKVREETMSPLHHPVRPTSHHSENLLSMQIKVSPILNNNEQNIDKDSKEATPFQMEKTSSNNLLNNVGKYFNSNNSYHLNQLHSPEAKDCFNNPISGFPNNFNNYLGFKEFTSSNNMQGYNNSVTPPRFQSPLQMFTSDVNSKQNNFENIPTSKKESGSNLSEYNNQGGFNQNQNFLQNFQQFQKNNNIYNKLNNNFNVPQQNQQNTNNNFNAFPQQNQTLLTVNGLNSNNFFHNNNNNTFDTSPMSENGVRNSSQGLFNVTIDKKKEKTGKRGEINFHNNNLTLNNTSRSKNGSYNNSNTNSNSNLMNLSGMNQNSNFRISSMISTKIGNYSEMTDEQLSKIAHVISKDQCGCRFIQKRIKEDSYFANNVLFPSLQENMMEIIMDPFGNYLIQMLLECLDINKIKTIIEFISTDFLEISNNPHGTRVVQKIIEIIAKNEILQNVFNIVFKDNIVDLSKDINGNHIIQKYFFTVKYPQNQFLYEILIENLIEISMDKHGCCVMQKCIDAATEEQRECLVEIVLKLTLQFMSDQYANYIIQCILSLNNYAVNKRIAEIFLPHIKQLSKQKYSSNVIEKCFDFSNPEILEIIVREICEDESTVPELIVDMYGNYVLQKALAVAKDNYYITLLKQVANNLDKLRSVQFGNKLLSKLINTYKELPQIISMNNSKGGKVGFNNNFNNNMPMNNMPFNPKQQKNTIRNNQNMGMNNNNNNNNFNQMSMNVPGNNNMNRMNNFGNRENKQKFNQNNNMNKNQMMNFIDYNNNQFTGNPQFGNPQLSNNQFMYMGNDYSEFNNINNPYSRQYINQINQYNQFNNYSFNPNMLNNPDLVPNNNQMFSNNSKNTYNNQNMYQ